MGCHTNFYIPANLTYEQAKKLAVIELNRMLEQNERYMSVGFKLHTGKVRKPESEEELKMCIYCSKLYKRWIRRIESEKSIWKAAVWKFQKEGYLFDKLYYMCKEPYFNDCIKVWGLSDIELTSLKETLEFFNNHKDKITDMRDTWLEEVTKFWQLYPKGIIRIS